MGHPLFDVTGVHPNKLTNRASTRLVCSDVFLGVEVEAEGITREVDHGHYWTNCSDGSLRDNGREYKFSNPMKGEDVVNALFILEEELNKANPKFNKRTGVHVHVDVRDMYTHDLLSFAGTYMMVEKLIFKYCGKDRASNIYCLPIYVTTDSAESIGLLLTADKETSGTMESSLKKYQAINLKSIYSYGTMEFRQYKGTCNAEELILWINMILSIRKYSLENTLNFSITEDPVQLVRDIFGTTAEIILDMYATTDELEEDLLIGIRTARDITNITKFNAVTKESREDEEDLYSTVHGED